MNGWDWAIPALADSFLQATAALTVITCCIMAIMALALIITWKISGDLERLTVLGILGLWGFLGALITLTHAGYVYLALWLLIGLMEFLVTYNILHYGVATTTAAFYVLPICLAACGVGLWPAVVLATLSAGLMWSTVWAYHRNRVTFVHPLEAYHVTFVAPMLTVLYLIIAIIVGAWGDYLRGVLLP